MKEHADKYFGKRPPQAQIKTASIQKPQSKPSLKLANAKRMPAAAVAK
jgi:hypothetical protein